MSNEFYYFLNNNIQVPAKLSYRIQSSLGLIIVASFFFLNTSQSSKCSKKCKKEFRRDPGVTACYSVGLLKTDIEKNYEAK